MTELKEEKKTGLVLEGGGMRGIYTAGVLDMFLDHDISFDGVIGVSAGAVHGASFVSGQKERSIRYYKKYCNDKRFMSFKNWLRTGNLVDEQFCFHDIPERLDPYDYEAFDRGNTRFYVACSNVETGKAEYLEIKDMFKDVEYFRATASLPYVSHMVEVGGMKLLDGGCTDSIPLRAFAKMGYKKCVVVLTRPAGYRKKPGNFWLPEAAYHKYPAFVRRFAAAIISIIRRWNGSIASNKREKFLLSVRAWRFQSAEPNIVLKNCRRRMISAGRMLPIRCMQWKIGSNLIDL